MFIINIPFTAFQILNVFLYTNRYSTYSKKLLANIFLYVSKQFLQISYSCRISVFFFKVFFILILVISLQFFLSGISYLTHQSIINTSFWLYWNIICPYKWFLCCNAYSIHVIFLQISLQINQISVIIYTTFPSSSLCSWNCT